MEFIADDDRADRSDDRTDAGLPTLPPALPPPVVSLALSPVSPVSPPNKPDSGGSLRSSPLSLGNADGGRLWKSLPTPDNAGTGGIFLSCSTAPPNDANGTGEFRSPSPPSSSADDAEADGTDASTDAGGLLWPSPSTPGNADAGGVLRGSSPPLPRDNVGAGGCLRYSPSPPDDADTGGAVVWSSANSPTLLLLTGTGEPVALGTGEDVGGRMG